MGRFKSKNKFFRGSSWVHLNVIEANEIGPYEVGFRQQFILDPSRVYPAERPKEKSKSGNKRSRPLLIASWYPAILNDTDVQAMPYERYVQIKPDNPNIQLEPFADDLSRKTFNTVKWQMFAGQKVKDEKTALLTKALTLSTGGVYGAQPHSGPFPLIINHPGLSGSYEECALLFEYLASHGFIVISSAYQPEHGASLSIDGNIQTSLNDIAAILRMSQSWSNVDNTYITVIGHSYGAEAALIAGARNPLIDHVIMIDSTLDYNEEYAEYLEKKCEISREMIDMPILAIAEARANFAMIKACIYSDRQLLKLKNLEHNDFLSHAMIGETLCKGHNTTRLVKAHQKQRDAILNFLKLNRSSEIKPDEKCSDYIETLPGAMRPSNAREIRLSVKQASTLEAKKSVLEELMKNTPKDIFYILQNLGYELRNLEGENSALLLFEYCLHYKPNSTDVHIDIGESYNALGNSEMAQNYYKKAKELLADDKDIPAAQKNFFEKYLLERLK